MKYINHKFIFRQIVTKNRHNESVAPIFQFKTAVKSSSLFSGIIHDSVPHGVILCRLAFVLLVKARCDDRYLHLILKLVVEVYTPDDIRVGMSLVSYDL